MLFDSNIIIYAAQTEHDHLRCFIASHPLFASSISYVEVMDYRQISASERLFFEQFFQRATILPISEAVLEKAFALRKRKKMTLSDAIIGGTALVHRLTLVTRNTGDFQWIDELSLLNPFETEAQ